MRPDIQPGAQFPDYELPDQGGTPRWLSEIQGSLPMVLHLSRGNFCPKEHRFLRKLVGRVARLPRLAHARRDDLDATTRSTRTSSATRSAPSSRSCPTRTASIQQDLDIQEYTDPVHDPMIPHTFVLEPGLKIHSHYIGYWFWARPTMYELHLDLRGVMKKFRPDYDPQAPGLREAWEGGDKKVFLVEPATGSRSGTRRGRRWASSGRAPLAGRSGALWAGQGLLRIGSVPMRSACSARGCSSLG